MAKAVGLYIGVSSIGLAVAGAKSLVNLTQYNFSDSKDSNQAIVDEDVQLEALINKALREVGAEGDQIHLSLADRDFIFRSLDMPLMRKSEIESSLVYEVEKFIPFKMDELEWTYASQRFVKDKRTAVSFVGIRQSNLERVRDILKRMGLKTAHIEPSSLSLARIIRASKRFPKLKDYGLLDLTEAEAHLTFFQSDLPAFNRYLTIPKKEDLFDSAKFSESVDFSFQYFSQSQTG